MQQFCISSIRDLFAKDVERFRAETLRLMAELLAQPPAPAELIREAVCQVHALKGLTSLVGAWGLSQWGANLEKLLAATETLVSSAPAKAEEIFQFVFGAAEAWRELNQLTIDEKFDQAQAKHEFLRAQLAARWPDQLADQNWTAETAGANSKLAAAPAAELLEVKKPALNRREPQTPSQISTVVFKPGGVSQPGLLPEMIAPRLRKKEKPARANTEQPDSLPNLVAPKLKRRVVTSEPAPKPAPVEAKKQIVDSSLLDLLRGELEGYLRELSGKLMALAPDISKTENWETVRRLFHTIKGTAATFHRNDLSAPAKAAEARCITALEDASVRDYKTFVICVERASQIATVLSVAFDSSAILDCLPKEGGAKNSEERDPVPERDFANFFITDARAQIETVESALLRWERGENAAEQVAAVQRGFHTLKGAANSIGLRRVGKALHAAESHLTNVASGQISVSPEGFARLFKCVDELRQFLKLLEADNAAVWEFDWHGALSASAAQVSAAVPIGAEKDSVAPVEARVEDAQVARTISLEAAQLYKLLNLVGELISDRARLERKIEQLAGLQFSLQERNTTLTNAVADFQKEFEFNLLRHRDAAASQFRSGLGTREFGPAVPGGAEFSDLEFDRYDQFGILARSLVELAHDIDAISGDMRGHLDSFKVDNVNFAQTSRKLQESVVKLTMIPMDSVFPRLERAFRDACRAENKDVRLELLGGGTQLDKTIVDRIHAPLLHLLRNAVSHGIEPAEKRAQLKKPAQGTVRLTTGQASNQVVVEIADDGGGINVEAIRERAIAKGWIAADSPALSAEEAVHFIFQPGFSTANAVTEISGRGIGLDVVRNEIESLNGSVEVRFEPQVGTVWTLRLPTNLAISEAVIAECGGVALAFPLNFIVSGHIINPSGITKESNAETYRIGEEKIPLVRLPSLLRLPSKRELQHGLLALVGERRVLLATDRVFSRKEIVVKQLDALMGQHPLLSGATLDAEGKVIPILNVPAVVKHSPQLAAGARAEAAEAVATEFADATDGAPRVLIVDDSLSVRKAQERFLADLGCRVTAAKDGLEALERLRNGVFDLIFTDLEMPQLNGYELIVEIRNHPAWTQTPVVVISSRGADKYITKAMNLGANSFLPKPFTEQQLVDVLSHFANWDGRAKCRALSAAAV